jgi:hypothetical protein
VEAFRRSESISARLKERWQRIIAIAEFSDFKSSSLNKESQMD